MSRGQMEKQVVRCEHCGEDYSITYKRCPFCAERLQQTYSNRSGGKRLATNTRGGGYGHGQGFLRFLGIVISLALIVAAVYIVISILRPLLSGDNEPTPTPSSQVDDQPSDDPSPPPTGGPDVTPPVETIPPVIPVVTGLTLSHTDITLVQSGKTVQLTAQINPSTFTGPVTWASENPAVATVNADGLVTAVGTGRTNIAVSAGDRTVSCIIRCRFSSSATPSQPPNTTPKLSKTDFTLFFVGEKHQLTVQGAQGTPTWSIGNSSVATVADDGTVTAVGRGMTTVTVSVDGKTLTCIVRVHLS